jgi:Spx/MgsR family transcriptional regulator
MNRPRVLYGIPHCDTVKRARAWLAEQGADVPFHDFKRSGVPPQAQAWLQALGPQRLVNRQGTTWRKLDEASRAGADTAQGALALVQAQPSVIKRPVVEWADGSVTVGFDAVDWQRRLQAGGG